LQPTVCGNSCEANMYNSTAPRPYPAALTGAVIMKGMFMASRWSMKAQTLQGMWMLDVAGQESHSQKVPLSLSQQQHLLQSGAPVATRAPPSTLFSNLPHEAVASRHTTNTKTSTIGCIACFPVTATLRNASHQPPTPCATHNTGLGPLLNCQTS
jgi:hypothetical protein